MPDKPQKRGAHDNRNKPDKPGRRGKDIPEKRTPDHASGRRDAAHPSDEDVDDVVHESFEEAEHRAQDPDRQRRRMQEHNAESPDLSGGDIDAGWDRADVGDETVGGTVITPDQNEVEELGRAVGVTHEENEPLHTEEKVEERDRHRWENNPASSEDYEERLREEEEIRREDRRREEGKEGAGKNKSGPHGGRRRK